MASVKDARRIAFIITGLGMGGAENQVVNLCDQFALKGHSVLLISLSGPVVVKPKRSDVKVVSMGMLKSPISAVGAYVRARRLLQEFKPNIVHSHMVHANLFARALRISVWFDQLICTAHSSNEGGRLRMALYRLTDWIADLTTNVSHDGVARFIKIGAVPAKKIKMVPNGIDCDRFRNLSTRRSEMRAALNSKDEDFVFLAVGRFVPEKDYFNLLRSFHIVQGHNPSVELWIAGSGAEMEACKKLASELDIAERIKFLGVRYDIPEVMSASDAFVLSSKIEGLPLVVGEAMACERPVVVTDAGGVRELVDDIGSIVPVEDSAQLAVAMMKAASLTSSDRQESGRQARAYVEKNYSLAAVVSQWSKIYGTA